MMQKFEILNKLKNLFSIFLYDLALQSKEFICNFDYNTVKMPTIIE